VKRREVLNSLKKIDDPGKDFGIILSNLHYMHFYLMDKYKKILSGYGLTSPQSNVLGIIGHFERSMSLGEIKEMVLEHSADVSRIVGRLAEKGLVEKVVNKENRRKVAIKMTAKGNKIYQKIQEDQRFMKFTSSLSSKEANAFINTLRKLRAD
jgi:DNA-binding MarR family transcriptional regulator